MSASTQRRGEARSSSSRVHIGQKCNIPGLTDRRTDDVNCCAMWNSLLLDVQLFSKSFLSFCVYCLWYKQPAGYLFVAALVVSLFVARHELEPRRHCVPLPQLFILYSNPVLRCRLCDTPFSSEKTRVVGTAISSSATLNSLIVSYRVASYHYHVSRRMM